MHCAFSNQISRAQIRIVCDQIIVYTRLEISFTNTVSIYTVAWPTRLLQTKILAGKFYKIKNSIKIFLNIKTKSFIEYVLKQY